MVVALGLVVACEVKFEDVSRDREFKNLVGTRYEIIGTVDAYGIRAHSKAPVEYITFIPPPGVEGSQIDFRLPIAPGSKITVLRVLRSNRLIDNNISFAIELQGTKMPVEVPMRIELFRGNEGEGRTQLNPTIYRRINP